MRMKRCIKCGKHVTHNPYSIICLECRKPVVIKKPEPVVPKDVNLKRVMPPPNEGKNYEDYNPSYKKPDFLVSPQRGKKRVRSDQTATNKLNKLLKRNI